MRIFIKTSLISLLVLLLTVFSQAQNPPNKNESSNLKNDASEYRLLTEKVKGGDLTVDFVKLRAAYLDWVNDECNETDAPNRDQMVKAFEGKNWANAAQLGEAVLDYEFVNRGLHLAVANAYKEVKNPDKEKFHT